MSTKPELAPTLETMREVREVLEVVGEERPGTIVTDPTEIAQLRAKKLAAGWWRSPAIDSVCANCEQEFVLHVWTEDKPSPSQIGRTIPLADSEGGMVVDNATITLTEEGVSFDWVTVCDRCSPI